MLARENPAVDDGWLCDKGRCGYQAIHSDERITQPLIRDGGHLRPVSWERALAGRGRGTAQGRRRVGGARRRRDDQRGGLSAPAHLPRGARLAATSTRGASGTLAPETAPSARAARAVGRRRRHRPRRGRARDRERPDQRGADHRPAGAQGRAPLRRAARRRRARTRPRSTAARPSGCFTRPAPRRRCCERCRRRCWRKRPSADKPADGSEAGREDAAPAPRSGGPAALPVTAVARRPGARRRALGRTTCAMPQTCWSARRAS